MDCDGVSYACDGGIGIVEPLDQPVGCTRAIEAVAGGCSGASRTNTHELMKTQNRSRQVLVQGLLLVMVGLLFGFVVPHTPHPRLALGAHVQFVTNGLLFLVMGVLLLKLPHNVGPKSTAVMLLATWLTWLMAVSEAANGWWGTTQMLPIAAAQAKASGGAAWQESVVKLTHIAAGLGLVIAWGLLVAGFVRKPAVDGNAEA